MRNFPPAEPPRPKIINEKQVNNQHFLKNAYNRESTQQISNQRNFAITFFENYHDKLTKLSRNSI